METFTRDVFADVLPVAGRVLIAPLFIGAGLAKFGDIAGTAGYMQAHGMPLAELLVWPASKSANPPSSGRIRTIDGI